MCALAPQSPGITWDGLVGLRAPDRRRLEAGPTGEWPVPGAQTTGSVSTLPERADPETVNTTALLGRCGGCHTGHGAPQKRKAERSLAREVARLAYDAASVEKPEDAAGMLFGDGMAKLGAAEVLTWAGTFRR